MRPAEGFAAPVSLCPGLKMILVAISFPLGLLCLYLGCLGWRKNLAASAVLLLFAVLNLGFALAITTLVFFFSQRLTFL